MRNSTIIAIYISLAILSALIVLSLTKVKHKHRLDGSMQLFSGALLCWQLVLILYYSTRSFEMSRALYDVDLGFVGIATVAYFLLVARFYGLDCYFSNIMMAVLFVIPAFTVVISATSYFHFFLRQHLEIISTYPVHQVVAVRGPWFWVHTIYCYLLAVVAFTITLIQHRKIPRFYRFPSTLLLIGLFLSTGGNLLVLSFSFPFDLSLVAITFASVPLYYAISNNQGLDFFLQARREVFYYLDNAVFILDDEDEIISVNRTARKWLREYDINPDEPLNFKRVTQTIWGQAVRSEAIPDEENGTDYFLRSGKVYNIRCKPVQDKGEKPVGTYAVITDVTGNRRLIQSLEDVSGMDALTGLGNRRQMDKDAGELDNLSCLPLTVIMGDLNNLKKVNDRLGHLQGDTLLRVAAKVLVDVCPPRARISRCGGDEFVVLLPGCDEQQAHLLMDDIRKALRETTGHPFIPSMALGCAVKERPEQNLWTLIEVADANMYTDKAKRKR